MCVSSSGDPHVLFMPPNDSKTTLNTLNVEKIERHFSSHFESKKIWLPDPQPTKSPTFLYDSNWNSPEFPYLVGPVGILNGKT